MLESLEGRLVLSSVAAAHAAAGHAHVHHLATQRHGHTHSPVIAHLSPQQTAFDITSATFDRRTKVITIKGTMVGPAPGPPIYGRFSWIPAVPPPPYTGNTKASVSVTVSQATDRRDSISGSADIVGLNSVVGQKSSFTFALAANPGHFARGIAVVSLSASLEPVSVNLGPFFSGYYHYPTPTAKMVVKLSPRPGKLTAVAIDSNFP